MGAAKKLRSAYFLMIVLNDLKDFKDFKDLFNSERLRRQIRKRADLYRRCGMPGLIFRGLQ